VLDEQAVALFQAALVAAQLHILADVIEKEVDRRRFDRVSRRLFVRRGEADGHLGRGFLPDQICRQFAG